MEALKLGLKLQFFCGYENKKKYYAIISAVVCLCLIIPGVILLATIKTEKKIITDKKLELSELSDTTLIATAKVELSKLEADPANYERNYTAGAVLVVLGLASIGIYPGLILYEKFFEKFLCSSNIPLVAVIRQ